MYIYIYIAGIGRELWNYETIYHKSRVISVLTQQVADTNDQNKEWVKLVWEVFNPQDANVLGREPL